MRKLTIFIFVLAVSLVAAGLFYFWAPRTYALMPQAMLRTETGDFYLTGRAFVAKRWFFSRGCHFILKTDATFEPSWFATDTEIGNATGIALDADRVNYVAGSHLIAYETTGRKIEHVKLPEVSDQLYGMSGGHHKILMNAAGERVIAARGSGDETAKILAAHRYGQILWSKTLPGGPYPDFASFQKTSDGGYLLLAEESPRHEGQDTFPPTGARLIKISATGDTIWNVALTAHSFQSLKPIAAVEDADGNFVILGRVIPLNSGGYANGHYVSLTRVNVDGRVLLQMDLNDKRTDETFPRALLKNPDGTFTIVATSADGAVHLLKLNNTFRLTDIKTLPLTDDWNVAAALVSAASNIILTGWVSDPKDFDGSLNSGIGLVETDWDGKILKSKTWRREDLPAISVWDDACGRYGLSDALFGD